ncbi:uncharacterized protein OGAPODRAFT_15903 [Ogataea polymorpha]|uniref:uncharacterized protein n=1 Tax=Ogataea polymorpha TaxID=460523 RepID=UPI0007F45DDD|nr:uncharacterized protein OGAPODRAFT_15903 [Ogataea polymorpha]KAG7935621.1 hypothetical protein KL934_002180 [Ogataea polymorpha]OBA17787.1 hypothetical protein OGAPODRAFT_15903 [Ogataea polymorpha]
MDGNFYSSYTILFDLFKPDQLIGEVFLHGESSVKAAEYLGVLDKKHLVNFGEDLFAEPWTNLVFANKDIFTELPKKSVTSGDLISSLNSLTPSETLIEQKVKALKLRDTNKIDYRFSRVEVEVVDMNSIDLQANEPLKAKLLGYGVIRLFRDRDDIQNEEEETKTTGDETMVAILGVPFYFSASDLLLGFFDTNVRNQVSHFRLIRTQAPNRFMVLMKFKDAAHARDFVDSYNGRPFNSMEPETCQVVFIKEILFRPNKHDTDTLSTIPYLLDDPFTSSNTAPSSSSQLIELASCPVCLERLDSSVTGLLTIPCQHTFHCQCLSKWKDDSCPVCRYSAKFDARRNRQADQEERCLVCGTSENLWICLICGNIGCGRYDLGHAIDHYNETSHCFAMEATSQRVWDYAGDNYVHRLVQNEADGKLVELPIHSGKERDSSSSGNEDKVEKIGFEYSKMLIAQLESQREFYEMKLEEASNRVLLANENIHAMREQLHELQRSFAKVKTEKTENSKKQRDLVLEKKYKEEVTLNEALSEKVDYLTKENQELKAQNAELQEQVNDIMFYLESQEKFKNAPDEVKEGKIITRPSRKAKEKR